MPESQGISSNIYLEHSIWCRLPESNWRPFHYELSILIDRMGLRSKSCIESCIENSLKTAKELHPNNSKNATMNALMRILK